METGRSCTALQITLQRVSRHEIQMLVFRDTSLHSFQTTTPHLILCQQIPKGDWKLQDCIANNSSESLNTKIQMLVSRDISLHAFYTGSFQITTPHFILSRQIPNGVWKLQDCIASNSSASFNARDPCAGLTRQFVPHILHKHVPNYNSPVYFVSTDPRWKLGTPQAINFKQQQFNPSGPLHFVTTNSRWRLKSSQIINFKQQRFNPNGFRIGSLLYIPGIQTEASQLYQFQIATDYQIFFTVN